MEVGVSELAAAAAGHTTWNIPTADQHTMSNIPAVDDAKDLDACFIGIPLDTGSCNRPGSRFGPREIRKESFFMGMFNMATGAMPLNSLRVADLGNFYCNIFDLPKACVQISEHYSKIIENGCRPLTIGGDHTISYPILQAMKKKYGKVGLIHVDAHCDTHDELFGVKIMHGTPFRRAVDEDLLDCKRVVQIGIRGWGFEPTEIRWGINQGFRVVPAADCWYKSLAPLMQEVREQMGDCPVYLSFDIDALDPAYAPGTGTPEVGGLTSIQGLEIIRGCKGLNIVGADMVEVSPQYDTSGKTANLGANLLFEMLCILPGVKYVTADESGCEKRLCALKCSCGKK